MPDKKTVQFKIRISEQEKAELDYLAEYFALNRTNLIRMMLAATWLKIDDIDYDPEEDSDVFSTVTLVEVEDLKKILRIYRNIGVNVNQLVHANHKIKKFVERPQLSEIQEEVKERLDWQEDKLVMIIGILDRLTDELLSFVNDNSKENKMTMRTYKPSKRMRKVK